MTTKQPPPQPPRLGLLRRFRQAARRAPFLLGVLPGLMVGLMAAGGATWAAVAWFTNPEAVSVNIEGQIAAEVKTFTDDPDTVPLQNRQTAVQKVAAATANDAAFTAATSETVTCGIASNSCIIRMAVQISRGSPDADTRNLTFTCVAANGYSCDTSQVSFTKGGGRLGSASVTLTIPTERGANPGPISITGTWS